MCYITFFGIHAQSFLSIDIVSLSFLLSSWADGATQLNHINASFDQECAAVVLARMAVLR